jgi:hypothetical protein
MNFASPLRVSHMGRKTSSSPSALSGSFAIVFLKMVSNELGDQHGATMLH